MQTLQNWQNKVRLNFNIRWQEFPLSKASLENKTYGVDLLEPSLRTISMPFLLVTPITALADPKSIPKQELHLISTFKRRKTRPTDSCGHFAKFAFVKFLVLIF